MPVVTSVATTVESLQRTSPLLSVIVVVHNNRDTLDDCLRSLLVQDVPLEILIVDSASTDGTVEWIATAYPQVNVIRLNSNVGYAAGNNRGLDSATCSQVLVLNPDTIVHDAALSRLLEVSLHHPRAFVTPKLLRSDGLVNACGNQMHYTGITTCVGLGSDPCSYTGVTSPLLVSGAAIMASRAAWEELGGFDENFFMYLEDADLSLRARARGYEIVCAADATVTHRYNLSMRPGKYYFLERNRLAVLLKNFDEMSLIKILPGLLLTEAATCTFACMKGLPFVRAKLSGYLWLYRRRAALLHPGSTESVTGGSATLPALSATLPYRELVRSRSLSRALEKLTTPLFRALRPGRLSVRAR